MKKTLLFLMLIDGVVMSMRAQTHYGTGSGTLGTNHSYFGYYAGNASTSSGGYNSFFGARCGQKTTTGHSNTAIGSYALYDNTQGFYNTAVGVQALSNNVYGSSNVAIGKQALFSSNYYGDNTANGYRALYATTDGLYNTATGTFALRDNTTGSHNTATGFQALYNNLTADYNVATGAFAMIENTTGEQNSAYGIYSLSTTSGSLNTAFGSHALYSEGSSCSGSYNTAFGVNAGFASLGSCNLNNTTALGYLAKVTASNQVRIGNSEVTSIGGQVSWSTLSDGRFKRDLKSDVSGLDFINELNPVSYTLDKAAFDKFLGIPDSLRVKNAAAKQDLQPQVGFIAQEVEAILKKSGYVFSGVERPKSENDPYTIRYAEFVVPLVKAVQELADIADAREKEIGELNQILHNYLEDTPGSEKRSSEAAPSLIGHSSVSGSTEFHVLLPSATTRANLMIYDLEGKELKDIEVRERGIFALKILSNEFHPGTYLYALVADGHVVATDEFDLK